MPSRTFLFQEETRRTGFKPHKDRLTLLMCGNAAGHMIAPGLINKSRYPRTLKNKNKALLPVYWMSNRKAWVTKALTFEWFHNCFIPQVKLYLAKKNLPFKVLLLMDYAGGHATEFHVNGVRVDFLPPHTTSLVQPMDQGVIRTFKALYTRSTMESLIASIDDQEEEFSLKACWCNYTITSCLANIQKALQNLNERTLNWAWKKLWPNVVHDYESFSSENMQHSAVDNAVRLAKMLRTTEGFFDCG